MTSFSSILRAARHVMTAGVCILLLAVYSSGTALAQDPEKPANSQNSQGSQAPQQTAVIETRTKSYVLEGLIFAVLCGAALYTVCRGSPRGR